MVFSISLFGNFSKTSTNYGMPETSAPSKRPTPLPPSGRCTACTATSTEGRRAWHIGGYPGHYASGVEMQLRMHRPKIFVCGHSHILKVMYDKKNSLLHINPGAAGIAGFHQVRTAIRLVIDGEDIRELEVGEWPRRPTS